MSKYCTNLICLVFALLVFMNQTFAETPPREVVKMTAELVGQATVLGRYSIIIDLTYQPGVETLGGRDAAIKYLSEKMKQIRDQGVAVESYSVSEPDKLYSEDGKMFAVLKTVMEASFPGGIIVIPSYLLGISEDQGKTWDFLDGAGLEDIDFRKKVLPKLPPEMTLPEKVPPKVLQR